MIVLNLDLESKFIGGLIGTGVGDAVGRSREGRGMIGLEDIYKLGDESDTLRYTDDTEQMIALTESLIRGKGFDGETFSNRLVKNFDISRGYGPGAVKVIKSFRNGSNWKEPAQELFDGEGSFGNGSSMRITPVGLFGFDDLDYLVELAKESSKVTHTHSLGVEGAVLQALSIGLAVNKGPSNDLDKYGFIDDLYSFAERDIYLEKLDKMKELFDRDIKKTRIINEFGNGVEAYNSVPTAIYSFLSNSDSFTESLGYSISLGGDADTIGAMTGAISGAYHGINKIPEEWTNKLENNQKITKLAQNLLKTKQDKE